MRAHSPAILCAVFLAACGGGNRASSPPANPLLTPTANLWSLCSPCGNHGSYCELHVGSGPEAGTPGTSASCRRLPDSCEDSTSCACFGDLKGCRCEYTSYGLVTECPAP
ncbi:MAG TPA: hypothetical protein VM513_36110 [Kofleriaceae bacterium]|nr:hypothetical protein [Kofleriaceae bacterium]